MKIKLEGETWLGEEITKEAFAVASPGEDGSGKQWEVAGNRTKTVGVKTDRPIPWTQLACLEVGVGKGKSHTVSSEMDVLLRKDIIAISIFLIGFTKWYNTSNILNIWSK